jgi:hypothetical protein
MAGSAEVKGATTVSRQDAHRGARIGDRRALESSSSGDARPVLSDDEDKVLSILVSFGNSKTTQQLAAGTGLPREQVATALDGLRAKGLVIRVNTLVESYAARFPGIEV